MSISVIEFSDASGAKDLETISVSKSGVLPGDTYGDECKVVKGSDSSLSFLSLGNIKYLEFEISAAELKAIGTAIEITGIQETGKALKMIKGIVKYKYDTSGYTTTGMSDLKIGIGASGPTAVLGAVDGPTAIGGSADKVTNIAPSALKNLVLAENKMWVQASANAGGASAAGTLKVICYLEEIDLTTY